MATVQMIVCVTLVILGMGFMLVGSIGIIRLPDFFSRTHATSKSDTLGVMLVIAGLIVFEGFTQSSLKLVFIEIFIALSNPVGTHALGRAALKNRVKPLLTGRVPRGES